MPIGSKPIPRHRIYKNKTKDKVSGFKDLELQKQTTTTT